MSLKPVKPLLLLLGVLLISAAPAAAMDLPPGFQARTLPLPKATAPTWTNGIQKPSTIDFAPDGSLFVAERNGRVLEFDSIEDPTPTLVLNIVDKVMAKGDRGILGMKLDPEYPDQPYLYLSYTYDAPIGGDSDDSTHTHYADGGDDCVEEKTSGDCLVSGRLSRVEINPANSIAVGGPVDPSSEQVLINSWCQQTTSHSVGDIEFDAAGALLMSGGEGASWGSIDFGQLGNYCNDPEFEGGSLRAQDLRTPASAGDPTDYGGTIIRVDRETGAALPNNPLSLDPLFGGGIEDVAARRILADGLRNPYRFTIQPGTGELYVGDVGQDLWEEVNHFSPPPATGVGLTNFGWPCFEGGREGNLKMPRWQAAEGEIDQPLCEPLYSAPSQVTAPLFAYPHANAPGFDGRLFEGDACDPDPGSAVAGLTFYDLTGVPAESALPVGYDGALFFADAARGCIWTMREGLTGAADPATVANFAVRGGSEVFTPVDIVEGVDGTLFVPNFYGDSIVQIRYFPDNQAPDAELTATSPNYGEVPLDVDFDASGSTDPDLGEGDTLHYHWDLDGDGDFDDEAGPTASGEYTEAENVTVKVRVTDDFNHLSVAEVKLYPGDLGPPEVEIHAPTETFEWTIGEPVPYEAVATDPDGDWFGSLEHTLTAHWEFTQMHCPVACHEHPITSADEPSGSFIAPPHEPPVHLKLEFTATDSRGMSDSEVVEVFPRMVDVSVASEPPGVALGINGSSQVGPFASSVIAGGTATVAAPATATIGGIPYAFESWSDGGARVHEADTSGDVDLVARYLSLAGPPPGGGGNGSGFVFPPPVSPPSVGTATVRLASRPPGVRLRVGARRQPAPFASELEIGSRTFLAAPKTIHRQGRTLRFKRWSSGGRKLGAAPRRELTIFGPASYLAVYAATAQTPRGGR